MKKWPSSLLVLVVALAIPGALTLAQTDPISPCCAAVNFQTFNPQDVAIQLVSVARTGPDDITVTWQILNRSKTPQQFDKMAGLAAFQLVWDAEVIDLASRTRFKVASDPKTRIPVAAKHDPPRASQGVGLAAGRTLTTWAKFLVPSGVTKVTVSLPGAAKPWENVTIANSNASPGVVSSAATQSGTCAPDSTAVCRAPTCQGNVLINAASCSQGTCPGATTTDCSPYSCNATACRVSCVLDTDCSQPNFTCDVSKRVCLPRGRGLAPRRR